MEARIMGTPLLQSNSTLVDHPRLTYVLYWRQRKGPDALQNGHAALIIDSHEFLHGGTTGGPDFTGTDWYVSWLGGGAGGTAFKQRGVANTFFNDSQEWGGHPLKPGSQYRVPTKWVAVQNLNRQLMKQEWDQIRNKLNAHWKLFDKNCATVVARILKAGGGDQLATKAKHQLVWWPSDLLTYAKSMGANVYKTSHTGPGIALAAQQDDEA
jgi:hypothetical protein